jgi:GPH family glycoside/pentoside/hexuronide:cation symporter
MLVFGGVAMVLLFATFLFCKERVAPMAPQQTNVIEDLKVLLKTRAWSCLAAGGLLAFSVLLLPVTNAVYYMTYVAQRPDHIPVYLVLSGGSMMLAAIVSGVLTKFFCKRTVWRAGSLGAVILLASLYFVDPQNLATVYLLTVLANLCIGVTIPINFAMASDVADLIELEHGRRMPGLVFSGLAFAGKAGLGLGGALAGMLLAIFGYVPNVAQTPLAIDGIKMCMSLIPAVGCLALLAVQMLYPLDRAGLGALSEALGRKRAESNLLPA